MEVLEHSYLAGPGKATFAAVEFALVDNTPAIPLNTPRQVLFSTSYFIVSSAYQVEHRVSRRRHTRRRYSTVFSHDHVTVRSREWKEIKTCSQCRLHAPAVVSWSTRMEARRPPPLVCRIKFVILRLVLLSIFRQSKLNLTAQHIYTYHCLHFG